MRRRRQARLLPGAAAAAPGRGGCGHRRGGLLGGAPRTRRWRPSGSSSSTARPAPGGACAPAAARGRRGIGGSGSRSGRSCRSGADGYETGAGQPAQPLAQGCRWPSSRRGWRASARPWRHRPAAARRTGGRTSGPPAKRPATQSDSCQRGPSGDEAQAAPASPSAGRRRAKLPTRARAVPEQEPTRAAEAGADRPGSRGASAAGEEAGEREQAERQARTGSQGQASGRLGRRRPQAGTQHRQKAPKPKNW